MSCIFDELLNFEVGYFGQFIEIDLLLGLLFGLFCILKAKIVRISNVLRYLLVKLHVPFGAFNDVSLKFFSSGLFSFLLIAESSQLGRVPLNLFNIVLGQLVCMA